MPVGRFEKDIAFIERTLRKLQLSFESGLILIGSREQVTDRVRLDDAANDQVRVTFEDRLVEARGKA